MKQHHYNIEVTWTGNTGEGTTSYTGYKRDHTISAEGKENIFASSDPAFKGDASKYNPEELFLASISTCHMLWFLHLAADAGIIVESYIDKAEAIMEEWGSGGKFKEVILHPEISLKDESKRELLNSIHEEAHKACFIANSCNFPITIGG